MKAKNRIIIFLMVIGLTLAPTQKSDAFIWVVVKAVVKKVIQQIDLQVQKLQNKTIALQNAQKELENAMSKSKLKDIGDWMEKQRKLYDDYYQELKKVKEAISTFQTVRDIAQQQSQLVQEYKGAYSRFRQDKNFTPTELSYMYDVYTGIINESARNLDQLLLVVSSFQTQMTDGKRLVLIRGIGNNMQHNLSDVRKFNNQNELLSIQRSKKKNDVMTTKQLYGLPLN